MPSLEEEQILSRNAGCYLMVLVAAKLEKKGRAPPPPPPPASDTRSLLPDLLSDTTPPSRGPPPPVPGRPTPATAQRSLLDDDIDDRNDMPTAMSNGPFSRHLASKPILPNRPSATSSIDVLPSAANAPRLPARKASTSTTSSTASAGPPPLPTRQGSALSSGTINDGPLLSAKPPVLPVRKATLDAASVHGSSETVGVSRRPTQSQPTQRSSTSMSPVEAERKAGSVLGAIAAFEAASENASPPISRSSRQPQPQSQPQQPQASKIKRKPAPQLSDLLERDGTQKTGASDEQLTPTATGDFVLVAAPAAASQAASAPPASSSPEKAKKGPPPVSRKPENLRATSSNSLRHSPA